MAAAWLLKLLPSTLNGIHTEAHAQNPWALNYKECKHSMDKKPCSIPPHSDGRDSEVDFPRWMVSLEQAA